MNREDVIRMAREADILVRNYYDDIGATLQELERFAALVAAAEREACAKAVKSRRKTNHDRRTT